MTLSVAENRKVSIDFQLDTLELGAVRTLRC